MASAIAVAKPVAGFSSLRKDLEPDVVTIGHGSYTYKADKQWAKISVNNTPLFNCHEMVQDSKGRLIMLER